MQSVFKAYAKLVILDKKSGKLKYDYSGTNTGTNYESISFKTTEGKNVNGKDTPNSIGLKDGDKLVATYKKADKDDEIINIKVVSVTNKKREDEGMFFKLRMNTNMNRVYKAYCKRKGYDMSKVSFSTGEKGSIHLDKHNPKSLGLSNGDSIIAKYVDDTEIVASRKSNPMYNICKEGEGNRADGNATSASIDVNRQKIRLEKVLRSLTMERTLRANIGVHSEFPKLCCTSCKKSLPQLPPSEKKHDAPPPLDGDDEDDKDEDGNVVWYHEFGKGKRNFCSDCLPSVC